MVICSRSRDPVTDLLRWPARILAGLIFGLILLFAVGEGLPAPHQLSGREQALMACFLVAWIGMLTIWWSELVGGILILTGTGSFYLVHRLLSEGWPRGWVFPLLFVPGILALICLKRDPGPPAPDPDEEDPQYLYRLRPVRPAMLAEGATKEEEQAVGRHFTYLQRLCREGVVILAGRTLTTDESSFGIVILRSPSEARAREIMEQDPVVQEGVMEAQLFPYRIALLDPEAAR